MKKILFIINQLYKGGAENSLINILNQLNPKQYEVDLVIYDHETKKDRIDLIGEIPDYVNYKKIKCKRLQNLKVLIYKFLSRILNKKIYQYENIRILKNKQYDIAISYGEWFSPRLLVEYVNSEKKIVWIHTDIDKAQFFNEKEFFNWDYGVDLYCFVSNESKKK